MITETIQSCSTVGVLERFGHFKTKERVERKLNLIKPLRYEVGGYCTDGVFAYPLSVIYERVEEQALEVTDWYY